MFKFSLDKLYEFSKTNNLSERVSFLNVKEVKIFKLNVSHIFYFYFTQKSIYYYQFFSPNKQKCDFNIIGTFSHRLSTFIIIFILKTMIKPMINQ